MDAKINTRRFEGPILKIFRTFPPKKTYIHLLWPGLVGGFLLRITNYSKVDEFRLFRVDFSGNFTCPALLAMRTTFLFLCLLNRLNQLLFVLKSIEVMKRNKSIQSPGLELARHREPQNLAARLADLLVRED